MNTPVSRSPVWNTSSGGPSQVIFPFFSTISRFITQRSRSIRCSTSITVMPNSLFSRFNASIRRKAPVGSNSEVGSSRTSISGFMAIADAIATRCFSPPDNSFINRSLRCSIPMEDIASEILSATSCLLSPRFSGPNAISDSTSFENSWLSGSWNTMQRCGANSKTSCSVVFMPHTVTSPSIMPLIACGISPFRHLQSVDLPQPLGPVITTNSPLLTCRFISLKAPVVPLIDPRSYSNERFLTSINRLLFIPFDHSGFV